MKKIITLVLLAIIYQCEIKSQILNGNFEDWLTYNNYHLQDWANIGLVSPASPSYSGNHGVRLQYNTQDMSTSLILHGGYIDNVGFVGGVPFASRPDSIAGFFKCYSPYPNEHALMLVIFKKNGLPLSTDYFFIPPTPDTLNYYEYKAKINYTHPTEIPDSVIILSTHALAFQDSLDGGFLIIDDLRFTNTPLEIPNGNFENWNNTSYYQPINWMNFNFTAHHHPYYPVQKTTDAYNGNYAARLQNSIVQGDTVRGVMVYSETLSWGSGFLNAEERYTSVKGYYKFFPENGDTLQIFMIVYKADTAVGFAAFSDYNTVASYKKFDVPIYYMQNFLEKPDSAIVFISAYGTQPRGNSILYLDDIEAVHNTGLIINEIMSSNAHTIYDFQNDSEDWIEVLNNGSSPVYMSEFTLSDDTLQPQRWRFPPFILHPDSFVMVFASGKDLFYPQVHTNFKIKSDGEPLMLSHINGLVCDYLPPVHLAADVSYGRFPDASANWVYFSEATPRKSNNLSMPFNGISFVEPDFSVAGGFFIDSFYLNISIQHPTAIIRYTTDGSEPVPNDPVFTQPILIKSRIGDTNTISMISETSLHYYPPQGEVFKSNIIRAKAFVPDSINVRTTTHTYFVDNGIFTRYNTPVISLVTDNENLFDNTKGIYVLGDNYYNWLQQNPNDSTTLWKPANYFGRGDTWERPIHIEYFEADGTPCFRKNAGVRIHGGASRMAMQKSLRIYARDKYDNGKFEHEIFQNHVKTGNNQTLKKFDRLLLRNSGNDWGRTLFQDALMHTLISHTKLDVMAFQPSVVFINGEYWGFLNIRERMDNNYISTHYNINTDNISLLEGFGFVTAGQNNDNQHYFDMLYYIDNNDISQSTHYNHIKTQMDVENFMLYQAVQIYYRNTDWPGNNLKFWRKRTDTFLPLATYGHDGRWRWLLYDTDFGFGFADGLNAPTHNTLAFATQPNGTEWPNPDWSTFLLRNLLNNIEFRNGFINTMADHINTSFKQNRMLNVIDSLQSMYSPTMQENIDRWRFPQTIVHWNYYIDIMRNFANNRTQHMVQHITDRWQISGQFNTTLNVSDPSHGSIKINTILIDENTKGLLGAPYPWNGKYFNDIPITLNAIPKPGYTFVEWLGTGNTNPSITVTSNQSCAYTAIFAIDTSYQNISLFINEFMASNSSTIPDAFGEYDDWIEIYNASADTVDIGGYFISDKLDNPTKHQFPTGYPDTKIPPNGFLLVWADGSPHQGVLHTNFSLSAGGEAIGLFAPDGFSIIDTLSFGQQITDISFGRYPDGSPNIVLFNFPTPGASNVLQSIEETLKDENLVLFPNPTNSIVFLNIQATYVEIRNVLGQIMLSAEDTSEISIKKLSKGLYLVKVDNFAPVKLIVQ